ncbi:MAG: adenylate/guanylate cyclase domain-containing protein [Actinomycetota bacterium]
MSTPATTDPIASARDAFERHAWQEAYDLLREADAKTSLTPEELEMLGQAAWWCGTLDDCISARERAYAGHLEAGNPRRAAFVALLLVRDHTNRVAPAVAQGWFRRAERLLADQPESAEHGHLEYMRARGAQDRGDLDESVERAARAVEMGAKYGDADLQGLALVGQGMAEVARGNVEIGFGLIDEATVAAVGGELSPVVTGVVYCNTISTCSEVGDYRRAGEWTDAARRWCERQSITGFPGVCRVHRAEIMRLRGWWSEAEQDARQACTELVGHGIPALAADGFNEVGIIRLRMGDLAAAEDAFRQAHELGSDAMPGLALLRLAQGQSKPASELVERALGETKEALGRARVLPAAVDISVANGDLPAADAAASELEKVAEEFGTEALRAAAACARANVRIAEGDGAAALRSAREGWKLWQSLEAPYESALARVCMGQAYRASRDEDAAVRELDAARSALQKLGAVTDLQRIAALLDDKGQTAGPRVVRTFIFTDIVRSTNLVEAIGDEAWEDVVGWHDRTLRALFAEHGGEEVSHAGDGFFVAFEDPSAALTCAAAIQLSLAEHRRSAGFAPQVRVGVHASEATQREGDYGGRGVHEAARIGAVAEGGEILASLETVDAAGSGWETSDPREVSLKGIATPAKVVTVSWQQG